MTSYEGKQFGHKEHMTITVESAVKVTDYSGNETTENWKTDVPLSRGQSILFTDISDGLATLRFCGGQIELTNSEGQSERLSVISPIVGKYIAEIPIEYEQLENSEQYSFCGNKNLGEYNIIVEGTVSQNSNPEILIKYDMKFPDDPLLGKTFNTFWTYFKSPFPASNGYQEVSSPFHVAANIPGWSRYDVPFTAEELLQTILNMPALKQSDYGFGSWNQEYASLATLYNMLFYYIGANTYDGCISTSYICKEISNKMNLGWEEISTFPNYTLQNIPGHDNRTFILFINPAAIIDSHICQSKKIYLNTESSYPPSSEYYTYYPMNTSELKRLRFDILASLGEKMTTGIPMKVHYTDNNSFAVIDIDSESISRQILLCLLSTFTQNPENMKLLQTSILNKQEYQPYRQQITAILNDLTSIIESPENTFIFGLRGMRATTDGTGLLSWQPLYSGAWSNL